jgi:hypothetical protein
VSDKLTEPMKLVLRDMYAGRTLCWSPEWDDGVSYTWITGSHRRVPRRTIEALSKRGLIRIPPRKLGDFGLNAITLTELGEEVADRE